MRGALRVARVTGALALAAGGAASCTKATAECDCADPGITVTIPTDVSVSVSAVRVSGAACDGVTPACANPSGGCSQYRFLAKTAGVCHIEVDFATGTTFSDDVTIVAGDACCDGFYAQPPSAAQVDVPSPDGGH